MVDHSFALKIVKNGPHRHGHRSLNTVNNITVFCLFHVVVDMNDIV